jgi:hypothetical protein
MQDEDSRSRSTLISYEDFFKMSLETPILIQY